MTAPETTTGAAAVPVATQQIEMMRSIPPPPAGTEPVATQQIEMMRRIPPPPPPPTVAERVSTQQIEVLCDVVALDPNT